MAIGTDMSGAAPAQAMDIRECPREEWLAFLGGFTHFVLVANSDDVDIGALQQTYPDTALFFFFNKVYKVLDAPFTRNAVLVTRSGPAGANIVYRREVDDVLRYFPAGRFSGVINLKAADQERFSAVSSFHGAETRHLDLTGLIKNVYPGTKLPTSGFALALWLCDLQLSGEIILAGFSAKRSETWKVFSIHDWTYEQVFLRLFARLGKIRITSGADENMYAALARHFPQVSPADIALTAAEVLSERLENANTQIDRLMSVTKILRRIDNFLRSLKPKTRKQRLASQQTPKPDA